MLETDTAARSADVFDTSLPLVLRKKSRAKFDESTARHADFFSAVGTLLGTRCLMSNTTHTIHQLIPLKSIVIN